MNDQLIAHLVGGDRFKDVHGYRFDKLIFGLFVLLILALFVVVFLIYGSDRSDHIYYNCNAGFGVCVSPFYHNFPACDRAWVGACDQKYIPDGFTFGDPAPPIVNYWGLIVLLGLLSTFLINHIVHNTVKGDK
jgi:hypothetical protein